MSTKTARRKRCKFCDELKLPDEVHRGICEDCIDYHEWCDVCQEYQHRDSECRHIVWTDCGYGGCGGTGLTVGDHKESFFALLGHLAGLPRERWDRYRDSGDVPIDAIMERMIASNNFWTFYWGPMFGTPAIDFRHEIRPGVDVAELSLEPSAVESIQDDDDTHLGMNWLMSLECGKTKSANAITVQWIKEWRATR